MRAAVITVALLSALWTIVVTLSAYMRTTGLLEPRDLLGAGVPVVISLAVTARFALTGGARWVSAVAAAIALLPFALLGLVAIQQLAPHLVVDR